MHSKSVGTSAENKTILVVDDESYVREAVSDILGFVGLDVIEANNGKEAVHHYKTYPNEISAVILDMQMPVMDGTATLYALRALNPQIKIIISSGYTQSKMINHFVKQGWARFLPKPYDVATLIQKVETTLQTETSVASMMPII
ncbi:MAG: response regulator [Candidatus Promineifilaceae bacterium]